MIKSECIEFNGIKFRRYPDSPYFSHRHYYSPNAAARGRGIQALHQEIWKAHYGPIPAGHHIHHYDGNALNNAIENLVCVPAKWHNAHHGHDPKKLAWLRKHAAEMRAAAPAWHSSPEGLEWHRQHGKEVFVDRPTVDAICEQCGGPYTCRDMDAHRARFCSNRCRAAWRRATRADDVERACLVCGKQFPSNRYEGTEHCSRKCAAVTAQRKRELVPRVQGRYTRLMGRLI